MSNVVISELKNRMNQMQHNPAALQRLVLEALKQVHNGEIEVIDADTPFGFLVQSNAVLASVAIDEATALNRKQYPVAAQTEEDLYLHMSDRDYLNRFALPSKAKFKFVFDKAELLSKLVEDVDLGIYKLVIPRNTKVIINNYVFTLQYPIEIRQLQHGGVQILYNTNIESPIQVLETNIIEYNTFIDNNVEWMSFDVELLQVVIKTLYSDTDLITNTDEDLILTDNYYFLRAYIERNGDWEEIKTTHTEQIYDNTKLTAVVKVLRSKVNVRIPQIYSTLGMVNGRLRFDLYETKGDINLDLSVFPLGVFNMQFIADTFDIPSSKYSAPLKNFKTFSVLSRDITNGGNDPMTLEELRNIVVNNSVGAQITPITPIQAEISLSRAGYDIVKSIDNTTNRVFLATKQLPLPSNSKLVTPASASIETIIITEKEAKKLDSVKTNFRSVTITPDTIFENKKGVMKLVPSSKVKGMLGLLPELLANEVTMNNYFYTPFHYVLDFGLEEFSARPYYLDKPQGLFKTFVSDNDRTLMQVSINEFDIERTDKGYRLIMSVKSTQNYKDLNDDEVFVQLAFKPKGEKDHAYVNGKLLGYSDNDERIFSFDLETNFYINLNDELSFTSFKMFNESDRLVPSVLENDFEVLFATSKDVPANWEPDDVDKKLGYFLLPSKIYGIANERVRLRLGYSLRNLWSRARSIISTADYVRYTADVPMVYENDVYKRDPDTGSSVKIVNGKAVYEILHRKGDPVLDENGLQRLKHKRGDAVLLPNGKPSYNDEYGLVRQLDILMVEGAYWFATDAVTVGYKKEIVDTFVNWIVDGLGALSKNLLEQTRIYFYPKSTVGQIDVMVNNSLRTIVDSGQKFKVNLYVSSIVYANMALRKEIKEATVRILSDELKNDVINNSNITARLKESYGSDVIAFDLTGLGGNSRIETITVLNDAKRCSLRKRLVSQGDGSLIVEEDVTCDFIRHDKKELD